MSFTVYKLNHLGEEKLNYSGEVIQRGEHFVCIRAIFSFADMELDYVTLCRGDIFTEWFYDNRWYNVFQVQDVETEQLKGYYCNFTRPAQISENHVKADDLALDLFIRPDGTMLLLDEEEYQLLDLLSSEQKQVSAALAELQNLVKAAKTPFDDLAPEKSE
jgi:hypothetical protein